MSKGTDQLVSLTPYIEVARSRAGDDPAHDFLHVTRVAGNATKILKHVTADEDVVMVAVWLHELFNYPKGHPLSHLSGDECAKEAAKVMEQFDFPVDKRAQVLDCIANHSFSKGVVPSSVEGKIVQDADRLDAIGAIGIARCFATCATMERPFYHPEDPLCEAREPDDKAYGVDHFYRKLLRIPDTLHTEAARVMAASRMQMMKDFLEQFKQEVMA